MSDCHWTPAQIAALEKIGEIVREHFEAGAVVLLADIDDRREELRHTYHGGKATALGLLATAQHRMLHEEPEEP